MAVAQLQTPPTAATRGGRAARGGSAASMLTVYLVLLIAVPSYLTIGPLGSLGRPSLIWGVLLAFWWLLSRLQTRAVDVAAVQQPVRFAFVAFAVIVLLSFAAAMLRGQPVDQISPAVTALIRLVSWAGVLLVTMDGIRTHHDAARLARRMALLGGALAAFGLAQFVTGQSLLAWVTSLPGVTVDVDFQTRVGFARASGTASHPLEYATGITASLPLAITVAVSGAFRSPRSRYAGWWWVTVALIAAASLLAVSRSAIIGLAVALLASLPAVPRMIRWVLGIGGTLLAVAVFAIVPGMLGTIVSMFAGASDDPSTQSRTNALARVPEFISSSPLIGQGFGIFLPRYYIFDNGWVLLAVETGILGVVTLLAVVVTAIGSAVWASRVSPFDDTRAMSKAVAASMATIAVLMLFFDGLSFAISAGLFFFIAGFAAAMRTIAAADRDASYGREARAATPRSAPSA